MCDAHQSPALEVADPEAEPPDLHGVLEEFRRQSAQTNLLDFMKYVWWEPRPFVVGLHTDRIARRISQAVDDYLAGKSTFLGVSVPFRHGKSDMVSRALPAYFMGRCRANEPNIMSTGYGADLVQNFARKAKSIVESPAYHRVFPGIRLCPTKRQDRLWKVDYLEGEHWRSSAGEVVATGLLGALTGAGYDLGVVDDYCKSREEAESERYREKTWQAFTNDFLTRRAPVSITIITATRWHVDDVIRRIEKAMEDDPDFPKFEFMSFPARGPAQLHEETIPYESEFLFLERFPREWYLGHYATLGTYGAAGLLDCSPTALEGGMLNIGRIVVHDDVRDFPDVPYVRAWDIASSKKERAKADPDFTAGALVGMTGEEGGIGIVPHVWVKDIVAGQWEAPRRDPVITATAARDGPNVRILGESVAGYKDTWLLLADALKGVRTVIPVPVSSDKVVRATPIEPIIEAEHFHILRADWNAQFFTHFLEFPFGLHDDIVDAITLAVEWFRAGGSGTVEKDAFAGFGVF